MLILFGTRNRVRRVRPLLDTYCYECGRSVTWDWYCVTEWMTAYLIPVLPVKDEHLLVCATCTDRVSISKEEARAIKRLAELDEAESSALHDDLVAHLEEHQLRSKTPTQRDYLRSQRRERTAAPT